MDRDRVQDPLERPLAADLADLRRVVGHLLEDLEDMPLRALVFVDRHQTELSFAPRRHSSIDSRASFAALATRTSEVSPGRPEPTPAPSRSPRPSSA